MPVQPNGKLTPAYFAALKAILEPDVKESLGWANLGRPDIGAELGISYKDPNLNLILIEISSQLAKTEEAWVFVKPGEYEKRGCPDIKLLTSMLNGKRPRIIDFTNPKEFNIEVLIGEYGRDNLAEKVAVVNWCRSFIANKGVFIALEADVTVGGTINHGDKIVSTPAGTGSKPAAPGFKMPAAFDEGMKKAAEAVSNVPSGTGDWVGRFNSATGENLGGIHASDTEITFGPKHTFDPKNPAHVRLAKQGGYNPETGKKK